MQHMDTLAKGEAAELMALLVRHRALIEYADKCSREGSDALAAGLNDRAADLLDEARIARLAALVLEATA